MVSRSNIEWTEQTWNPVVGCSIVSPGCTNCYAMRDAWRKHRIKALPHYHGLTKKVKGNPVWTGKLAMAPDSILLAPLKRKKPTLYFVNSMGDLFHEDCPDEWIDRVFAVMALSPQHTFQVLTKRAARMREWLSNHSGSFVVEHIAPGVDKRVHRQLPLPNVWLGVSCERQEEADARIPLLLQTPAAVRFISAEPLLGPIDARRWMSNCYECGASCGLRLPDRPSVERCERCGEECDETTEPVISEGCPKCGGELEAVCPSCGHYMVYQHPDTPNLDWVIAGGESGPKARPMHPDWPRALRDQCKAAGVAFHFKQWGEWAPGECANKPATRSEQTADWFNNKWVFGKISPSASQETHHDDAPDLYRLGKKSAGRLLDGVQHDEFPKVGA